MPPSSGGCPNQIQTRPTIGSLPGWSRAAEPGGALATLIIDLGPRRGGLRRPDRGKPGHRVPAQGRAVSRGLPPDRPDELTIQPGHHGPGPAHPGCRGVRVVTAELKGRGLAVVFTGLMLVMLMAALDGTIVATALPTIATDLGGLDHISWVTTAYLLAETVVMPLYGKLGDQYGRRVVLQGGWSFRRGLGLVRAEPELRSAHRLPCPAGSRRRRADGEPTASSTRCVGV